MIMHVTDTFFSPVLGPGEKEFSEGFLQIFPAGVCLGTATMHRHD
jgi:hypothetical protein